MRNAQYLLKPSVDLSAGGYLANQIVDNSYQDMFVGQSSVFAPYIPCQFAPEQVTKHYRWSLRGGLFFGYTLNRIDLNASLNACVGKKFL